MNIGFYYTHYQCLGHTTRVLTLLEAINKKLSYFGLFTIQGSRPQRYLRPPGYIKNYFLPFPLFSSKNFRVGYKLDNSILNIRKKALFKLIKRLNLSIFITEYFPLGRNICKYELLSVLYHFAKTHKKAISSVGYPVVSKESIKGLDRLLKFYKKIFIHSPRIEVDYIADSYKEKKEKDEYLKIFEKHSNKIIFTGYIIPLQLSFHNENKEALKFRKNKINILVTRGAGAYYPDIIASSIKASDILGKDFYFIIVAGPSTSYKEENYFKGLMNKKKIKNAILIKYTSSLKDLIKNCDLCICCSSYNTSVLLLYFKKNSIIIPFQGYGDMYYREQPSRARMLKDFIGSKIINYCDLTPSKLAKEIDKKIKNNQDAPSKNINKNWFKGKDIFLKEFYSFLMV